MAAVPTTDYVVSQQVAAADQSVCIHAAPACCVYRQYVVIGLAQVASIALRHRDLNEGCHAALAEQHIKTGKLTTELHFQGSISIGRLFSSVPQSLFQGIT
jgi:hypothetical protein